MSDFQRTRRWRQAGLLALLVTLLWAAVGCGPKTDNAHVVLAAPQESTTLGPGDIFTLQIVGETGLPVEFQVASDGTVDFPYIHRVTVKGLEPQDISRRVREQLIDEKILVNPNVTVRVLEYRSKRVTVLGRVREAGSFPLATGMTLLQAISQAGGLSAVANRQRINLTRQNANGPANTVTLSFDAITEGRSPDVPLQAGDQIYVNERVF